MTLALTAIADDTSPVDKYITMFERQSPPEQKRAAQELAWAGLNDPRLFDVVEAQLLAFLPQVRDRRSADQAAWLTKALAYSGDERYRPTLKKVCNSSQSRHGGLSRHCQNALLDMDKYKVWNPIIADRSGYLDGKSDEVNRYATMLRSGNYELQRLAAKRIHYERLYDDWLLDQLQQTVEQNIDKLVLGDDKVDAVGWLLRTLAGPGMPKYRPTLERATKAPDPEIRSYAKRFIGKFY